MAHIHNVYDTDIHYKIDGVLRTISNVSEVKRYLVQGDHNSERFTFELPRHIDGHDMSTCNVVQVRFLNLDKTEKYRVEDAYNVDDLQVSPDGEDVVIFSWLISGNATKYAGTLNFIIRFCCVNDGDLEYSWNTAAHKGVSILDGMEDIEDAVEPYSDIIAEWEGRIQNAITKEYKIAGIRLGSYTSDRHEEGMPADVLHEALGTYPVILKDGAPDYQTPGEKTQLLIDTVEHAMYYCAGRVLSGINWIKLTSASSGSGDGTAIGISSATINDNGELVITYTNGNESNLGVVKGAQGPQGPKGDTGQDGIGIEKVECVKSSTNSGEINIIQVTLTDGTSTDFHIRNGDKGDTGEQGIPGADGKTPVKGTDYWTAADKAEIVNETKNAISLNEYVKSVNNTLPDANGNVTLTVNAEQPDFVVKDTMEEALAWLEENGDTSKTYVLPDGYLYKYMTSTITYDKPNCNNLIVPEECHIGYRFSSASYYKTNDDRTITNLIPVNAGETYDIRAYLLGGVAWIAEFSDVPEYTLDAVPTNFIRKTDGENEKVWDEPKILTHKFTHTMADNTKYIALDVYCDDSTTANGLTVSINDGIITLNEPVVLGTTPTTIETTAWTNTGHSYQATDYEDRIIAIEEVNTNQETRLTALESGTASTIPYYWQSHLDEKVDNIREAMELAGRNKSSFLFYSDAHWDDGGKQAPMVLNYLFKHTPINKTLFGGDIVSVEPTTETLSDRTIMEYLWKWRSQIRDLKHYSVLGNHDDGNANTETGGATNSIFTLDYVYSFLFAPEEGNHGIVRDADTYYYFDDNREKTRYICLDTTYDSLGALSTAQAAFFKEALKSTSENWHVVVVSHIWYGPDYDQYSVRPIPIKGLSGAAQNVCDIVDAYNARTGDFTSCKAKVEFCIGGHVHRDYVGKTTGGTPIITVDCASLAWRGNYSASVGTISETAVSGVIADYDNDKVSIIRVGRGKSFEVVLSTGVSDLEQED